MEFKAQKIALKFKVKREFSLSFKEWAEDQNWSSLKKALFFFLKEHASSLSEQSFCWLGLFCYFRCTFRNRKVPYFRKREISDGK